MSEELKRHKEALEVAMSAIKEFRNGLLPHHAAAIEEKINEINAILHPEPEYEEVEIVRWSSGTCSDVFLTEAEAADPRNVCGPVVKLTGTLRRPKPVKVERSVTVEKVIISVGGRLWQYDEGKYVDVFTLYPECHGKTVTLTAAWTE